MRGKQDHSRERSLRAHQTEAERLLWERLRARRAHGLKFRRQHRIGAYFADFFCAEARLVVEVDGGQHVDRRDYDEARTGFIESQGYRVLRVWNDDVLARMAGVLDEIFRLSRTPHPASLHEAVLSPLRGARAMLGAAIPSRKSRILMRRERRKPASRTPSRTRCPPPPAAAARSA